MRERLTETIAGIEGVKAQNELMMELIEAFDIAGADGDAQNMFEHLERHPISDPANLSRMYANG